MNTARFGRLINGLARYKGRSPAEIEADFIQRIPLGRICQPEDLGNLVAFLASD